MVGIETTTAAGTDDGTCLFETTTTCCEVIGMMDDVGKVDGK